MIATLLQGTLAGDPVERTSSRGTRYATVSVRVSAGAESLFIGLSAFEDDAIARLLKLSKGSAIAAAGTLELNAWTDREGRERRDWRCTATEVLSVHQARRRRETVESGE